MAQVILSAVGQQVGGGVGRVIGATIGRAIDDRAIAGLGPARQIGPRLETLKVQGTAEGAPFSRAELDTLMRLADGGIRGLLAAQAEALAR